MSNDEIIERVKELKQVLINCDIENEKEKEKVRKEIAQLRSKWKNSK